MKRLIALLLLVSAPVWAGTSNLDIVNISRTLTLTSPSAYISMTGVSSTAYFKNVSATGVLYSPGVVKYAGSAIKTDAITTTSTTFADIPGLSVTVTPTTVASRYILNYTIPSAATNGIMFRLMRGTTPIGVGDVASNRISATSTNFTVFGSTLAAINSSGMYVDTPSSTAAVTYKVQVRVDTGTGYINRSTADTDSASAARTASSLIVQEIQ